MPEVVFFRISHDIVKKQASVPRIEIDRARLRMRRFVSDPNSHTYREN